MALRFYYEIYAAGVLQTIVELGDDVVRFGDTEFNEAAEVGEAGICGIRFDDPDGSLDIVGWRRFYAKEDLAPEDQQIIYYGRMMDRTIRRGGSGRESLRLDNDRVWDVDLVDSNNLLSAAVIRGSEANRPAETAGERLTWLLTTSYMLEHADKGHVTYPTNPMDAVDYRGQTAKDVLADCCLPGGYNFWGAWNEADMQPELFFLHPDGASYTSSIRATNDLGEVDGVTTFAVEMAELRRSPSRVAAGVYLPYSGGAVYVRDDDTGYYYAFVDRTAPMANVKSEPKATALANKFLADNDEESDRLRYSFVVPPAQVNDVRVGQLMEVKFTHLPDYDTGREVRVLRRSIAQVASEDGYGYRIGVEAVPTAELPGILSHAYVKDNGSPRDLPIPFTIDEDRTLLTFYTGRSTVWPIGDPDEMRINAVDGPLMTTLAYYEGQPPVGGGGGGECDSPIAAYAYGPTDGSEDSVYFTGAGSSGHVVVFIELAGTPAISGIAERDTEGGTSSSATGPAVTPTPGSPCIIFGWFVHGNDFGGSPTLGAGDGWTVLHSETIDEGGSRWKPHPVLVYKIVESPTGSYAPVATSSLVRRWDAITVLIQ